MALAIYFCRRRRRRRHHNHHHHNHYNHHRHCHHHYISNVVVDSSAPGMLENKDMERWAEKDMVFFNRIQKTASEMTMQVRDTSLKAVRSSL